MTGVVNEFPIAIDDPPFGALYQLILFPLAVEAPSVTVPAPQRDAGVIPVIDGAFTITVIAGCKQTTPALFFICVE